MAGGDLDLFDSTSGIKLAISGDNTDAFGFYSVCVPPGVYRVTFAPPPGTRLLGREFEEIDLRSTGGRELDVVLDSGAIVAGVIRTADGTPIGGADVNADRVSGGRLFTPNDKSAADLGTYAVVLPHGLYRLRFTPPRAVRWQMVQLDSVAIDGDRTLDVTLPPAVLLRGRVKDDRGRPLSGVALDLRRREDGAKVLMTGTSTDANGDFEAVVPRGTFELRFMPPPGNRAVATRIDSVTIDDDTWLNPTLVNGLLVTAVAFDPLRAPLPDTDLDVVQESTGAQIFLPQDSTDPHGRAILAVPADRYSLRFDPPAETALDHIVLRHIDVMRDTTITAQLPGLGWMHVSGRVVDAASAGIADATVHVFSRLGTTDVAMANTDRYGQFDVAAPAGDFDLLVAPPRLAPLVARRLPAVTLTGDSMVGDVVLQPGAQLRARIVDAASNPVNGARLHAVVSTTGAEVYTPHGESDADGIAFAALSPERYDVTIAPPEGSALAMAALAGLDVRGDTTVDFVLPNLEHPGSPPASFESLAPNPFTRRIDIGVHVRIREPLTLDLYDVAGRRIQALAPGDLPASSFIRTWDGRLADGTPAPSGVYVVILRAPGTIESRKIVLVR